MRWGTPSPWVQRLLQELGHEVITAHTQSVRLIYGGTTKDDQLDAERLARLGRGGSQAAASDPAPGGVGAGGSGRHPESSRAGGVPDEADQSRTGDRQVDGWTSTDLSCGNFPKRACVELPRS